MGVTRYAPFSPEPFEWDLAGVSGEGFENLIIEHLQETYSYDRTNIRVVSTPRHDQGRDAVITTRVGLKLFGTAISASENSPVTIHVECKLRRASRLEAEFFFDFSQFPSHPPDYYFLVTTASLTPYVHYHAYNECAARGVRFQLVDRWVLLAYMAEHDLVVGTPSYTETPQDLLAEYQAETSRYATDNQIDVYLVVRNFSTLPVPYRIHLKTDTCWSLDHAPRNATGIADPNEAAPYRLRTKRTRFEKGTERLEFGLTVDDDPASIQVTAPNVEFDFEPRMVGAEHLGFSHRLRRAIDRNTGFLLVSVTGRAGVGKSRVVSSALDEFVGTNVDAFRLFLEPHNQRDALRRFLPRIGVEAVADDIGEGELLRVVLDRLPDSRRNRVLILEDLHHASRDILDTIKQAVIRPPSPAGPLCLVLTGRNDFTFPNEDYYSLLELLSLSEHRSSCVELPPLTDREARTLIASTIKQAPRIVLDRVQQISENVPFFIVQAIEYLLETRIACLLSRNEVGVPNPSSIASRRFLPETIAELYELRLAALQSAPLGDVLLDFLTIQSFLGFAIAPDVVRDLLNPYDDDDTIGVLVRRRFVERQFDGELTFGHENLLHMLRQRVRSSRFRVAASALLLSHPQLFRLLDRLDQGEVYYLNGDYHRALERFGQMQADIESIDNFSSEDLEIRYFLYVDALFDCTLRAAPDPQLLRKILLAKAYQGIHNYPLSQGVAACEAALEQAERVGLAEHEYVLLCREINQLRAHGLLNMGATDRAFGLMVELDQKTRLESPQAQAPELLFDLYDRLQEVYKKRNHYVVAEAYATLARSVAEKSGNPKLLACHAITEVGMEVYRDPRGARERARTANQLCREYGAHRLDVYTGLSILVSRSLATRSAKTRSRIREKATSVLSDAAYHNLSDSLMRAQLLVATLTYLGDANDPNSIGRADSLAAAGIDSSLRFGNGLFLWLHYNLRGVIAQARGARSEDVAGFFNAAIRELHAQSLLFVGRLDFTYPSLFVVSNAVRYWLTIRGEREAEEVLKRVTSYDIDFASHEAIREAFRCIRRRRLFFTPRSKFRCFTDPVNRYWLPVL